MKRNLFFLKLFFLFLLPAWATCAISADVPRMTKEELKAMLGNPDLVIVDVRTNAGWNESKIKIKGAVREDPAQATLGIDNYSKEKTLVFYCS